MKCQKCGSTKLWSVRLSGLTHIYCQTCDLTDSKDENLTSHSGINEVDGKCNSCNGSGIQDVLECDGYVMQEDCGSCNGSVINQKIKCKECEGLIFYATDKDSGIEQIPCKTCDTHPSRTPRSDVAEKEFDNWVYREPSSKVKGRFQDGN